ncbi:hypothetical protein N8I77_005533 [Diaporthe amygdali]|uniref:Uncharacterized protein n=1 Tax=Phomopsis amygdali TaxID=1214568 RepID=A0AAD9SEN0_PHOAM|nr:hypothetical protein N8I77_005533 [Diaporthe amygdali]
MGNVSHVVPSFHGIFGIPTEPGVAVHSRDFAGAASTEEAHRAALESAKGMAMLGLRVLAEAGLAERARDDFRGRGSHKGVLALMHPGDLNNLCSRLTKLPCSTMCVFRPS